MIVANTLVNRIHDNFSVYMQLPHSCNMVPRIVVDSRILCDIESQWQMLGHPLQTPFCVLDGSFVLTIRFENAAIHKLFRNIHIIVRTKTLTKTAKEVFRGRRLFP